MESARARLSVALVPTGLWGREFEGGGGRDRKKFEVSGMFWEVNLNEFLIVFLMFFWSVKKLVFSCIF